MGNPTARGALVGCLLLSVTGRAYAQSKAEQGVALFKEARALVDAGKYAEACPKLEESQRLEPGLGTQFNLADCYEHTRRPATAWRLFRDVADAAHAAGKTEREKAALQRVDLLAPKLPFLRLTLLEPGAVDVRIDGRIVDAKERDQPIAIDPGNHVVEVTAPKKRPSHASTSVGDHGVVDLTVPALTDLEPGGAAAPSVTPGWPAQRTIGVITAAAGVVGLGIGSVFALIARDKRDRMLDLCPAYPTCSADDLPLARSIDSDGRSAATAATIAFIGGGVALGAGVLLILLTPSPSPTARLRVAPTIGGASLEGRW